MEETLHQAVRLIELVILYAAVAAVSTLSKNSTSFFFCFVAQLIIMLDLFIVFARVLQNCNEIADFIAPTSQIAAAVLQIVFFITGATLWLGVTWFLLSGAMDGLVADIIESLD